MMWMLLFVRRRLEALTAFGYAWMWLLQDAEMAFVTSGHDCCIAVILPRWVGGRCMIPGALSIEQNRDAITTTTLNPSVA